MLGNRRYRSILPASMIVLCCGSRYWDNIKKIEKEYDRIEDGGHRIQLVIEGEADGADKLSRAVAERRGIPVCGFFANWAKFGRAAGPIRNGSQIRFIKPDIVLAFHARIEESKGTKNMVDQAKRKGIKVRIIE